MFGFSKKKTSQLRANIFVLIQRLAKNMFLAMRQNMQRLFVMKIYM